MQNNKGLLIILIAVFAVVAGIGLYAVKADPAPLPIVPIPAEKALVIVKALAVAEREQREAQIANDALKAAMERAAKELNIAEANLTKYQIREEGDGYVFAPLEAQQPAQPAQSQVQPAPADAGGTGAGKK